MNWTLIRVDDGDDGQQVAKRVTKKDWGLLKEVKVPESKKRQVLDHSFEDDMLSRSFMNQTIVSQKEVEEPSLVQEPLVGAAEAEVKVLDAIVEEVKEELEITQKIDL